MILEFQSRHIRKEFVSFIENDRPDIASHLAKPDFTPNLVFTNLNEEQDKFIRAKVGSVARVIEDRHNTTFSPVYKT